MGILKLGLCERARLDDKRAHVVVAFEVVVIARQIVIRISRLQGSGQARQGELNQRVGNQFIDVPPIRARIFSRENLCRAVTAVPRKIIYCGSVPLQDAEVVRHPNGGAPITRRLPQIFGRDLRTAHPRAKRGIG